VGVDREEGGWDGGEERGTWGWRRGELDTLNGDGVSNLLEVLQLPKFPHFEGEGGDALNGDGVSNLLEVLQLPKFPHFEGEGGDGGPVVDGLTLNI
jgi:hypothetical protein